MTILEEAQFDHISRRVRERIERAKYRANSYVFSSAASELVGRFVKDCGELVINHRQFAIPPYPTTYIEFDSRAYHQHFPCDPRDAHMPTDEVVGYLFDGNEMFICCRSGSGSGSSNWTVIHFHIVPPGQFAGPHIGVSMVQDGWEKTGAATGEHAEWIQLGNMLGSTLEKIRDEPTRQALLSEVSYRDSVSDQVPHRIAMERITRFNAGDIRNAWAFLLWLNRPKHTAMRLIPARRGIVRGRQVAYRAHHTVEIDLGRKTPRQAFELSGPRASPIGHRVEGCFHHSGGDPAHGHFWPTIPDERNHWVCYGCGRKRWWVRDHVRGDTARGWVDKDYVVTVGEET
jgi:hypothetical protein